MFAIAFDMSIEGLKQNYGEPYNNAYFEINKEMRKWDFYRMQGSVYLTQNNDMGNLFAAIDGLRKIEWFKKSVRDIRGFRVEDWSNFTNLFKQT
ncbi:MAG: virulence protein [Chitinivibrionia bacterium]|nr:virulence protein [Chitinivibrionia bacterium]